MLPDSLNRLLIRLARKCSFGQRMEESVRSRILNSAELFARENVRAEDFFIIGYPKSGHTWFQNLVAGIVFGVDPELAPDALIQTVVPDLEYERFYRRFSTPMFFKSHRMPAPAYRRVIYLLRDGRDAMVSYYHYMCGRAGGAIDFMSMVRNGDHALFKWHEHVDRWLDNPFNARMMVVKYEDMLEDPVAALEKFCGFVGIERSTDDLSAIAIKCSFEKMRKKEMKFGWRQPWPTDRYFIRRGKAGSFEDEMPAAVLEAFMAQSRRTLLRAGYLSD